jgi:class 3 adenylate cyclase
MLPSYVIKALNRGERVMPQEFDSVTIFFSDIIGFTEIAANVQPLHIVKLLNQLYSVMDHCATYFPLFKVETIGDAVILILILILILMLIILISIVHDSWWYEW